MRCLGDNLNGANVVAMKRVKHGASADMREQSVRAQQRSVAEPLNRREAVTGSDFLSWSSAAGFQNGKRKAALDGVSGVFGFGFAGLVHHGQYADPGSRWSHQLSW